MAQSGTAKATDNNISEFNRFLNNNTLFIHQKYDQYLNQNISLLDLNNEPALNQTLAFIYDIFSFQKYQDNPKLNQTLKSSLKVNINAFVKKQTKAKQVQPFTKPIAIELLKYCIENNDMFAVHYDKKTKPEKNEIQSPEVMSPQTPSSPKKEREQKIQKEVIQEKGSENVGQMIDNKKQKEEVLLMDKQRSVQIMAQNEFEINERQLQQQKGQNLQLIKRQLKDVFQFYCKQMQSAGHNFTFDSINQKCHSMNIGKFITFCNAANILFSKDKAYSQGKIDKAIIVGHFKKKAEGKRQIDFKIFLDIVEELHKIDNVIYARMGLGEEGPKGRSKLVDRLKYISLPFSTRDPQGRQKSMHGKIFIPKLTTHSGKVEQDLRNQLHSRKQKPLLLHNQMKASQSKYSISRQKILSKQVRQKQGWNNTSFNQKLQKNITVQEENKHDYRFLSKLISSEDTDDIFLKDYGIDKIQQQAVIDTREERRKDDIENLTKKSHQLVLPLIKAHKEHTSSQRRSQMPVNRRYSNYH